MNTYGYVQGNPISWTDMYGLAKDDWPQTAEGCRNLKKKIDNLKKELERQRRNIRDNPMGLPTFPPSFLSPPSASVLGHVDLYLKYRKDLRNAVEDFNKRCGGPGGTPTPGYCPLKKDDTSSESSGNESNRSISPDAARNAVGAGLIFWIIFHEYVF